MFERYIVEAGTLRNEMRGGAEGFAVDVRLAYYRGLLLSMVEGFEVVVDGQNYDPGTMVFSLRGMDFTFSAMEGEADARWEFDESATLFVPKPGGLSAGEHQLEVTEILRISYMPEPARRLCICTQALS